MKKKHEILIDDPITYLAVAAREISHNPMDTPWDDTFF